jgi:hypothetical protein
MPNDLELELAIRDFYVRNGEKMLRDLVTAGTLGACPSACPRGAA